MVVIGKIFIYLPPPKKNTMDASKFTSMIFLTMALIGMSTLPSSSSFFDDVYVTFHGTNFSSGDHKLFLIVDVDSTGKIKSFVSLEAETQSNFDIRVHEQGSDAPNDYTTYFYADLQDADFIIIATMSADDSFYDEFDLRIDVWDSGVTTNGETTLHFGENSGSSSKLKYAVLKLHGAYLESTYLIGKQHNGYISGGSPCDWNDLWSYLDTYAGGSEKKGQNYIEDIQSDYTFPGDRYSC